ncbi:hypothetical protein H632_c1644p0 [Helicosporidium sp. ATCC 50920]|nr:hypothetical protein H632_c1644p0 [Helicosporidium sp. ATCC 50920]|eukprot:KDD74022.1 hypothetical protein H632_c1644p0 [Helicosporidium sp. ATCC 50920]
MTTPSEQVGASDGKAAPEAHPPPPRHRDPFDAFVESMERRAEHKEDEALDDDDAWGVVNGLNDTHVALQLLRQRFPQLYAMVRDRTAVDRELENMRRTNVVRMLLLPLTPAQTAVVLLEDYLRSAAAEERLDFFTEETLARFTDTWISEEDAAEMVGVQVDLRGGAARDSLSEERLSRLLRAGFLARSAQGGYHFALPRAGLAVKAIRGGEAEILAKFGRHAAGEVRERSLLLLKLRKSPLGVPWHLLALTGSDVLQPRRAGGEIWLRRA